MRTLNSITKSARHSGLLLGLVLCGLVCAPTASAYYDPGVQRWINRDPIDEPGSQVTTGRLVGSTAPEEPNQHSFVKNTPVNTTDALGLAVAKEAEVCFAASPLYPDDPACEKYGEGQYLGAGLKCFCRAPFLKDSWSNYVRGCLACMHAKGVKVADAHHACYASADMNFRRPTLQLAVAWCTCRE
jgi:RHS repeat-associated protein